VHTKTEWEMKRDISLSGLSKLQIDAKEVKYEDLMWCGKLHNYSRVLDRISAKAEMPLRRFEDLEFYNVSTMHDPHLTDMLQQDEEVCMIATDHVLACLIAAARLYVALCVDSALAASAAHSAGDDAARNAGHALTGSRYVCLWVCRSDLGCGCWLQDLCGCTLCILIRCPAKLPVSSIMPPTRCIVAEPSGERRAHAWCGGCCWR